MGYWVCEKHGKVNFQPCCIHLKENFESGNRVDFTLILEELSQDNQIYFGALLCKDCAKSIGVEISCALFFDPQLRRFENDEDGVVEDDIEYEDVFGKVRKDLVSVCQNCILEVEPECLFICEEYKKNAVEFSKNSIDKSKHL
ncbi:hypothetical protein GCM10008940_34400 [Microbulbifer agarilyticus]